MKTAIVVPTIRPESLKKFLEAWTPLIQKHNTELVIVIDGKTPVVRHLGLDRDLKNLLPAAKQRAVRECIYNFNDGVRNMGFLYVATRLPDVEVIITLDDDVEPEDDTIADHLIALHGEVPITWFPTVLPYMRGFPYGVRDEAPVWVSHGIWKGVLDMDAPTQLVKGTNVAGAYYRGVVPKGALTPICGMNLAFRREALPLMYFAPMGERALGIRRFADIWMGITMKRELDRLGKALVSGFATVKHLRASNVFTNLIHEAPGLELNEHWWKDGADQHPYFKLYGVRRNTWEEFMTPWCHKGGF